MAKNFDDFQGKAGESIMQQLFAVLMHDGIMKFKSHWVTNNVNTVRDEVLIYASSNPDVNNYWWRANPYVQNVSSTTMFPGEKVIHFREV